MLAISALPLAPAVIHAEPNVLIGQHIQIFTHVIPCAPCRQIARANGLGRAKCFVGAGSGHVITKSLSTLGQILMSCDHLKVSVPILTL